MDPYDIRNHIQYKQLMKNYIKKSDCLKRLKYAKNNCCEHQVLHIKNIEENPKYRKLLKKYLELKKKHSQKDGDNVLKRQIVALQSSTSNPSNHIECQRIIEKLKKRCSQISDRVRTETELACKKRMFTNIKDHPQYKLLEEKHQLDMQRLKYKLLNQQEPTVLDIKNHPEYRRLMAKYIACKDHRS